MNNLVKNNIIANRPKPVLLCILDGWGIGDESNKFNAIAQANLPNYRRILKQYPHSHLETSGLAVGLPEGQMGNSEVGHMTIGAGRVIFQDLPRINQAIVNGELAQNSALENLAEDLKKSGKAAHLLGLMSDGGVHSHQKHIAFLAKFLALHGVPVYIHAFLDGRDVAQKSAAEYLTQFFEDVADNLLIKLATISGRYYAMDRDHNWNRIKLAYDAIVSGVEGEGNCKFHQDKGKQEDLDKNKIHDKNDAQSLDSSGLDEALNIIENCYENEITDEFVLPCITKQYRVIQDGDAIISCNFRADRIREISTAMLDSGFNKFPVKQINFSHKLAMTEYSEQLNHHYKILFPAQTINNSLPQILERQGLTQLRIAETEKYAHVSFFFSCGVENELRGEKRIMVKSPAVATYDLQPEMSAQEIGEKLQQAIKSDEFDFIIVNYANPDMVGHSGALDASIKACEAIDKQLALLEKIMLEKNGAMLISADHGNIECMRDENHHPHTSHTTNPVPFIFISNNIDKVQLSDGALSDIAPTVLHLMNISQPAEMTGKNLLKNA